MQYALIYRKARFLDEFIDNYRSIRKRASFPHREVAVVIHFLFPGSSFTGRGVLKTVHKVSSKAKNLVLKTSQPKNIIADWKAYNKFPRSIRNRYFAKIYWKTKYCILQKYGSSARTPRHVLLQLRAKARTYGLDDIKIENLRRVEGVYKIVDANIKGAHRRRHRK